MNHRRFRGRIDYRLFDGADVGREWFTVTVMPDGARTVRALCELDDIGLMRDVTYSVDRTWRPLDAAIRLSSGDRFQGSSWFRFTDREIECEGYTAQLGRFSQRIAVPGRPDIFAPHPLVCDGWQAAAFDPEGPATQEFLSAHPSADTHGRSGPIAAVTGKRLEFLGRENVTVPAGTFDAEHFLIHPEEEGCKGFPLEFWAHGDDRLLVKMRWPLLGAEYVLSEFTRD